MQRTREVNMNIEAAKCLECGSEMLPIQVVEFGAGRQRVLEYTAVDAKPGIWLGRLPTEGQVGSRLCSNCGRIEFYAMPKEAKA